MAAVSSLTRRVLVVLLLVIHTACGILLGNVKPVEEKSKNYEVLNLSSEDSDWLRVPGDKTSEANAKGVFDMAYQSKATASIISLNSACRAQPVEQTPVALKTLARPLFFGVSDVTLREEKDLTIAKGPAFETTIRGNLGAKEMIMRAVVLHRSGCIYDLMLIAQPKYFMECEAAFSHFVASLKIKE